MADNPALENLVRNMCEAEGFNLVRARMIAGDRTLQVLAERPDGRMDVEDCARLSRALSLALDAADPIASRYTLEVSSPGIDRPLVRLADYETYSGHEAKLELREPVMGRKRIKAMLKGVGGGNVRLLVAGLEAEGEFSIPFSSIADAKLVLTDRLLREDLQRGGREQAPAKMRS